MCDFHNFGLIFDDDIRAGSGHFFSGLGQAIFFLAWVGSGWRFLAAGQFRPPILAYFKPIFADF